MCGQDARTTRVLLLISVLHKRITAVRIQAGNNTSKDNISMITHTTYLWQLLML
ncbi:MAG: hypothetical protein WBA52_03550 [Dolichospermum sp.]|uniref:hypothetical protein n=1 Tax=Dolichospermum planctonicum TaxID=136072 RepID=UPI00233051B3|nr:hypothetical protein [Dolichospermum planctonicum]